ncbi:MAG TPA: response regulator transcription factor [Solirubrobacterales bacterium]|nr:response regulator transcription factor [Solirubrobacterales bacterium]
MGPEPTSAANPTIKVAIVDDEALVRTGFTHILNASADIEVVAATDGEHAVATIAESGPDVVLLDIQMPKKNGLEVLLELVAKHEHPVIAMLTTFDTDEYIATALKSGASGFLVKDTDPVQLPQLVRTLSGGGIVFSPIVSRKVISGFLGREVGTDPAVLDLLTDRERTVLVRLAEGETNSEIGESLYLSVGTVKTHVSSILAKLGIKTRVEAALVAERTGLLSK